MARRRGGGGPSRMDLRREAEAVEAREKEVVEEVEDEEEDEEGDEEAEGEADPEAEAEGDADAGDADEGGDDEGGDDEDAPKKKKKTPKKAKAPKKAAAKKAPAKKKTRTAKEVRTRAVWVVFDNASKRVETFPYKDRAEAEAFLVRRAEEKKGTYYINLVKDPIE